MTQKQIELRASDCERLGFSLVHVTTEDPERLEKCLANARLIAAAFASPATDPRDVEREAFEAWYTQDMIDSGFVNSTVDEVCELRQENHYGHRRVMLNGKWEGWQARAALASRPESEQDAPMADECAHTELGSRAYRAAFDAGRRDAMREMAEQDTDEADAFEEKCREYGIAGTAAAKQCEVFWRAGQRWRQECAEPIEIAGLHGYLLSEAATARTHQSAECLRDWARAVQALSATQAAPTQERAEPSDDDIRAGVRAFQSGHNGFDDLNDWRAFYRTVSERLPAPAQAAGGEAEDESEALERLAGRPFPFAAAPAPAVDPCRYADECIIEGECANGCRQRAVEPSAAPARPLTDEEIDRVIEHHVEGGEIDDDGYRSMTVFARAIERAHGIKAEGE